MASSRSNVSRGAEPRLASRQLNLSFLLRPQKTTPPPPRIRLPSLRKRGMFCPSIVGMRGSTVIRLRSCTRRSTPLLHPAAPPPRICFWLRFVRLLVVPRVQLPGGAVRSGIDDRRREDSLRGRAADLPVLPHTRGGRRPDGGVGVFLCLEEVRDHKPKNKNTLLLALPGTFFFRSEAGEAAVSGYFLQGAVVTGYFLQGAAVSGYFLQGAAVSEYFLCLGSASNTAHMILSLFRVFTISV